MGTLFAVLRTIVEGTVISDTICGCNGEAGYVAINNLQMNGQLKVNDCHGSPTKWDIGKWQKLAYRQPVYSDIKCHL